MQTFLPFSDFRRSAAVLDIRRLGKQRVETLQILRALTFDDYGWRNHPAVTMWARYTPALVTYGVEITRRWRGAGFADSVEPQLVEFLNGAPLRSQRELAAAGELPPWVGDQLLHLSHQAALVRKDPDRYRPLFPAVDADLPYVWPQSSPPAAPTEPVTAWVVRASADDLPVLQLQSFIGLGSLPGEGPDAPAGTGTSDTKRRRQIRAFVDAVDVGDIVVVPEDDQLLVAEVVGPYEWRADAMNALHHVRPVRWKGAVHRRELLKPVHLQDPRVVFGLRNEPVLRRAG